MAATVKLSITSGQMHGKTFTFAEHDTFLCGRNKDCQIHLPDDQQISRHQFLLEINPPDMRIRDLGSRNGTYVNDRKYGGRARHETPEEGAQRQYPQVDLHDGDIVRIGQTTLQLTVQAEHSAASQPILCQRCGRNVSHEAGEGRQGEYVCNACREQAESDLAALLYALLKRAGTPAQKPEFHIPDYQIERELGQGGMGRVYLARHMNKGQRAALKIMLSKIAVDENARKKILREMESTRTMRHPNIVTFLEGGAQGSVFYFLLEYCEGGSLDRWLERLGRPLTLAEATPVMLQTIDGLAYIHEQGFVHRDLKPQNMLLAKSSDGWIAKIADLGLAKNFMQAGFSGMTATGGFMGSYPYMPREQVINFKYCKPVSDVWSLGATYYVLLTGQYPRKQEPGQDPLDVILQGEVIPLAQRAPHLPTGLTTVIDRTLTNNLSQRYQNASEMRMALTATLKSID